MDWDCWFEEEEEDEPKERMLERKPPESEGMMNGWGVSLDERTSGEVWENVCDSRGREGKR